MLGALLGDLAACTFKQDRQYFERELVGDDAFFSDKGLMALATADALVVKGACTVPSFKEVAIVYYDTRDKEKVHFPKWFELWCGDKDSCYSYDSDEGMALPMCCIAAPFDKDLSVRLNHHMQSGKAAGYAAHYFTSIIRMIKSGKNKHDIILDERIEMLPMWIENHSFGDDKYNAIHSLILAWIAFDFGYDFTSTIKHAARIGAYADTRVVTMLAATMAENFYSIDVSKLPFPKYIREKYRDLFAKLTEFDSNDRVRYRILDELIATHGF